MLRRIVFDGVADDPLVLNVDEDVEVVLQGRQPRVTIQLPAQLPQTRCRIVTIEETVLPTRQIQVRTANFGADNLRIVKVISGVDVGQRERFVFEAGYWQWVAAGPG